LLRPKVAIFRGEVCDDSRVAWHSLLRHSEIEISRDAIMGCSFAVDRMLSLNDSVARAVARSVAM
jgi:hypothetical protein